MRISLSLTWKKLDSNCSDLEIFNTIKNYMTSSRCALRRQLTSLEDKVRTHFKISLRSVTFCEFDSEAWLTGPTAWWIHKQVIVWTSAFDTAVSPELQVQKADSQVTLSPSLMYLCTLYLILPLCSLVTISRTKDQLIQKADTGTLLSRDKPVCRYFPAIACNLSSSKNKRVPCMFVFDGCWLIIVCRLEHVRMRHDLNTEFSQFGDKTRNPKVAVARLHWLGSWRLVGCNSNSHSFHTVWGEVLRETEVTYTSPLCTVQSTHVFIYQIQARFKHIYKWNDTHLYISICRL